MPPLHHDGQRYAPPRPLPQYHRYPLRPCPPLASTSTKTSSPETLALFPLERASWRRCRRRPHPLWPSARSPWWAWPNITQGGTLDLLARDHDVGWSAETLRCNVAAAFAEGLETHRPAAQVEQILEWLQQASVSHGRHRPSLVVGRDGIHLPMRTGQAYKEGATATLTVYNRRAAGGSGRCNLGRMPQPGQGTLSAQLTTLIEEVLRRVVGGVAAAGLRDGRRLSAGELFPLACSQGLRHPRTREAAWGGSGWWTSTTPPCTSSNWRTPVRRHEEGAGSGARTDAAAFEGEGWAQPHTPGGDLPSPDASAVGQA